MSDESVDLKQEINKIVHERLTVLSLKRFDEIAGLPSHSSEDIVWQRSKFILSIWHDVLPSQEHRVVIQAYKPGVLGIGLMQADGFAINSKNEKRSLTQQEWAPFS